MILALVILEVFALKFKRISNFLCLTQFVLSIILLSYFLRKQVSYLQDLLRKALILVNQNMLVLSRLMVVFFYSISSLSGVIPQFFPRLVRLRQLLF